MDHKAKYKQDLQSYITGFALAFILTVIPFGGIIWGDLPFKQALGLIGLCGLVQIIVHFRFFLHIDLTKQKREDLQLILFSFLILAIMAIGTIWIMGNLAMRM